MGKHRTPYPAEFRAQMVELVKAGRRPEELEKEFEPTAQTIYNWVAQAGRDAGVRHDGLTTAELDMPWGTIEPAAGTFNFTEWDTELANASAAGICVRKSKR